MDNYIYPKNPVIRNGRWAKLYLFLLKRNFFLSKIVGKFLGCEISFNCKIPQRLFLAHPNGIVVGAHTELGENVVLNHQVTLGGKNPHFNGKSVEKEYPVLKEGVYVGAGAKILGHIIIGEWAIIGANAVVTKDVPPYATVVGFNKIIPKDIEGEVFRLEDAR